MASETLPIRTKEEGKFGKQLRKEFLFADEWVNLNHGSFGTYPRIVQSKLRSFQDAAEARPDDFIRYQYPKHLDESREAVAKLLNVPVETIVFVPNATTGVNTVLRNLTYKPREHIVYFEPIYGACEKTVSYMTETTPVLATKIPFTLPVEDAWLVDSLRSTVAKIRAQGDDVKVAVFDSIVSMPGVRLPFEDLVKACKDLNILSCVDGAHGVGHVDLDLTALEPDFFISNCHKWLHTPRGCALFHVPLKNQPLIRSTLPTSHGFQPLIPSSARIPNPLPKNAIPKSPFVTNFEFVGTIDNAPYLCVPTALAWRASIGGEDAIRSYASRLAREGGDVVAKKLGTEVLDNATKTLTRCCMVNVRLPLDKAALTAIGVEKGVKEEDVPGAVRDWISQTLISDYQTFIACMVYGGGWWVRLSGQVYLEMADFEWAAEKLVEVCGRVEKGEWV